MHRQLGRGLPGRLRRPAAAAAGRFRGRNRLGQRHRADCAPPGAAGPTLTNPERWRWIKDLLAVVGMVRDKAAEQARLAKLAERSGLTSGSKGKPQGASPLPTSANRRLLDELEAQESGRYLDLCLVLRRLKTSETLLWAGGRWDRLDRTWAKQEPRAAGSSTCTGPGPVHALVCGLAARLPHGACRATARSLWPGVSGAAARPSAFFWCGIAMAIDVPGTIGWLVSTAHSERDEIDRELKTTLLPGWAVYREWPKHVHLFGHGSSLTNVSADDPRP